MFYGIIFWPNFRAKPVQGSSCEAMASSSSSDPATALQEKDAAQQTWRRREISKHLKNKTSAVDTVKDIAAATAAGARGCGDLSQIKADNHAARNLMNKL